MASGVFRLENFKGDGSQKVESYLKRFDQFKVCTGITDEQGLATLAWHLEGNARLWFEHLDPEPQTLGALRDLMLTKFKKPKQINMNVYSMTQQPGESVEDFLRRFECETFKTKINSEIQVQIALNGMDRTIGSAISTHAPKTLDEVKQLTSRMGSIRPSEPVVAQATALTSNLESKIDVLTAAVAKLSTTRDQSRQTTKAEEGCPRCGGRCYSSASCKAMGKTCYKCHKLNHFGNKCRNIKILEPQSPPPRQYQGYRR